MPFYTLLTAETNYLKIKIFGKNTLIEKKENDPIEWIIFPTCLKICGEKFKKHKKRKRENGKEEEKRIFLKKKKIVAKNNKCWNKRRAVFQNTIAINIGIGNNTFDIDHTKLKLFFFAPQLNRCNNFGFDEIDEIFTKHFFAKFLKVWIYQTMPATNSRSQKSQLFSKKRHLFEMHASLLGESW